MTQNDINLMVRQKIPSQKVFRPLQCLRLYTVLVEDGTDLVTHVAIEEAKASENHL